MVRGRSSVSMLAGLCLTFLIVPAARAAVILTTRRVAPSPDGLVCTVVNVSRKPIRITAEIVDGAGGNVTDFITTNWLDPDARVLQSVVSRSRNQAGRSCRITITGGQKRDVTYSLVPDPGAPSRAP